MDGYVDMQSNENHSEVDPENYKKYMYIQELYENQMRIDREIALLSSEIESLPPVPSSMEKWVSSFRSNFKISDFTKIFKINKKYRNLMEERKSNGRKIKMFAIDNIIDQINETQNQNSRDK